MIFVDTSAFVAFFLTQDLNHTKVDALFKKFINAGLFTSYDVINETLNWFAKKTNSSFTLKIAKNLLGSEAIKIIEVTNEERFIALNFIEKFKEHQISFTNAVSFAIISKLKIQKVFTLDSDFKLLKNVENVFYDV